ncbi:MAG TPA: hypothetical protein PLO37_00540 [Candidatus Hydrogenedentes bacterium]|nr:hypothetical protein [Candidatus Hydrogenedentota bacterium]HPG65301.1 hypothetical protein [Candidatus Hydrogenedentota bacterium]
MISFSHPWMAFCTPRARVAAPAILLLCVCCTGCVRLGHELTQGPLPEGAPSPEEILTDLAANDQAIERFSATGAFTLVSPERPGTDRFRQSQILFRKPADLHIVGRGPLLTTVFRLTCVGEEFLIEFPTEKEYYYQLEGEQFESVPFSVSPSDVAREMFLPEDWAALPIRRAQLGSFDSATGAVTLDILEPGFPRAWVKRRLTLTGTPWIVTRSERFDRKGRVLAVVSKSDYRELDGIRFPARVSAEFPGEQTQMDFDMRRIEINGPLDDDTFHVQALKTRLMQSVAHKPIEH